MNDLFEEFDLLPENIQAIITKYQLIDLDKGLDYPDLRNFQSEMENEGYTFNWGLDAIPFDLKKL